MTMLFDMLHHLDKIIEFVRSFLLKIYFRNPNFKDFKQMSPSLAKGIEDILQYNGDDFEADFELNFTVRTAISVESFFHYVVQVLTVITSSLFRSYSRFVFHKPHSLILSSS